MRKVKAKTGLPAELKHIICQIQQKKLELGDFFVYHLLCVTSLKQMKHVFHLTAII